MPNIRVLVVEDNQDVAHQLIDYIREKDQSYRCEHKLFSEAEEYIEEYLPDVTILDLLSGEGTADQQASGVTTYKHIWNKRFCPIVIHSAQPDAIEEELATHPFIKTVKKGKGGIEKVWENIELMMPQLNSIKDAEKKIRLQFSLALREVAPNAFTTYNEEHDIPKRNEMILRTGRRRLAALIDNMSKSDEKLLSWEQYICPPISDDLLLGDVLHIKGAPIDNPECFYVVLTPSCDLATSNGRTPKVENVLLASCCSVKQGINQTSLGSISSGRLNDKLSKSILSQGHFENILIFPKYEGKIPHMVANLKKLCIIPYKDILDAFEKIASIDSPFRELVAWSYMQVACRPGLPDRDFTVWAKEIINDYE